MLLTGMDKNESVKYLEGIRKVVAAANLPKLKKQYTLSIGVITVIPDENTQWEDLYISCNKALYQAKSNGRNCIFCGQYERNADII